jgi:hypothetical protein
MRVHRRYGILTEIGMRAFGCERRCSNLRRNAAKIAVLVKLRLDAVRTLVHTG